MVVAVDDINIDGKTLFVRCDLNVPLQDGRIRSAEKLVRAVKGLKGYATRGARLVVASHLGRPQGIDKTLSLRVVAEDLRARMAPHHVDFVEDCIGSDVRQRVDALTEGSMLLLENLRFHRGETMNDKDFALGLRQASAADIYVNDAFACVHRAHASVAALPRQLPCYAGVLLSEEIQALQKVLGGDKRPMVAMIGGAKISTKVRVLMSLVRKMDAVIIGGAMANTFLAAQGYALGCSLYEANQKETVAAIRQVATQRGCRLIVPVDACVQDGAGRTHHVAIDAIEPDHKVMDLGPRSVHAIKDILSQAATLVWNGPLGAFEIDPFHEATQEVAAYVRARSDKKKLVSVVGGGDTLAAVAQGYKGKKTDKEAETWGFSYASTGGGAFLEWCEGKILPGIEVLEDMAQNVKEA
ncbi:MAG: phosphoglycerate kinase [Alphaproteobacteria bacterium GM202ARS2]|nr:phosphoglycerate kinase [Alphaproteobacteria bacterium GM202ARS2]